VDGVFHIRLEHDEGAWTLVCGGELDFGTVPRLEEAFDLCERMRPEGLHIDGRDLTLIDSVGVSALIRFAHRCIEEGIGFSVGVSEQVRDILAHAGLAERLLLGRAAAS
jgi:anti-anti-sigma factor